MTHYITALTNDEARLIISETRTTDDELVTLIIKKLKAKGYFVLYRVEH